MKYSKKIVAVLLAFCMIFSVMPNITRAEKTSDLLESDYNPYTKLTNAEAIKGGIEVNRPGKPLGIKNVPLMAKAHQDVIELAEMREYDIPREALKFNEQTIYDLDSIGSRIKLIGVVINFIHRCTTELIYRNQYTHQTASREAFIAVVIALNPFNTVDDVENACQKLIDLFEEMKSNLQQYPELTAEDNATVHIKRIFNKDVREARNLSRKYLDITAGTFGLMGKANCVQNSYKTELEGLVRSVKGTVKVGFVVEVDNAIKALATSAMLADEVVPAPSWIKNVINPEIKEVENMSRALNRYLPQIDKKELQKQIRLVKTAQNMRGATYDEIAKSVYELRGFVDELRNKNQQAFEDANIVRADRPGDIRKIKWFQFEVPNEQVDPAIIEKIHWIVNPTFDFQPNGFTPDDKNVPIVVGYALGKPVYGSFDEWMEKRKSLKGIEDVLDPDWNEEEPVDPIDDGGVVIDFGW